MPSAETETPTSELMLAFYRRLYPFKSIFKWLNHEHSPSRLFTNREISFTLQNDVYLRYHSFTTADDFKKQTCTLNPTRFEIGPVYTARPRDKKTMGPGTFTPVQRELVFDIDMTDYDSIRTCCSGADICKRCWGFISAAVRVLDSAIRQQFGYKHLLWVYSGRRGIHLWVSDREAMALTDDQRRCLVNSLTVVQGGKEMHKKVNVRPVIKGSSADLPPSIRQALDQLVRPFEDLVLLDQNCFRSEEGWKELLQLIPDSKIVKKLERKWTDDRSSDDKWTDLMDEIGASYPLKATRAPMTHAIEDIILQYTYPRIDAEVSKHRNHLLKAPFCVHPKTGRICVPVDPETIDEFDPELVPTVGQLLRELDAATSDSTGEEHSDWERTSLKPYVDMLEKHALSLMNVVRKDRIANGDRHFMVIDEEYDLRMWGSTRVFGPNHSSIPGWAEISIGGNLIRGSTMSSPSISPSPSSTTDSITSTPTASSGTGGGAPATATLLFGFLVIFAALFAAFLFLAFFWKFQQRRQTAFLPEFDDIRGSNRGVPKLWEVWIRDEPSEKEWNWENATTTPLSLDVGRVRTEQTVSPPTSRSRRPWPYSLLRRRSVRPPRSQAAQQQQQVDAPVTVHSLTGTEEATTRGPISGTRVSLVIVMPHRAETPDRRRSEISQISHVVEQQQNWRRREYAIGIYHPSFREGWTL